MGTRSEVRESVLEQLISVIEYRSTRGTQRVAIDGIDAAGKTTMADELAALLRTAGYPVLRASIDGFHHPASVRHLRAELQPAESYYEDSFDYEALRRLLLDPLGPDGDRVIRTGVFDFRTDRPVEDAPTLVELGTVLLFDGVFLLRPELEASWDLSVFVHVDPAVGLQRGLVRDAELFGSTHAAERCYRERYIPGQELYLTQVRPHQRADVLVDNSDPLSPRLLRVPSC